MTEQVGHRDEYGILHYGGQEYDSLTHFLPESEWRACVDIWGNEGFVIGYRDKVQGQRGRGFGGEYMVMRGMGDICSLDPSVVKVVE